MTFNPNTQMLQIGSLDTPGLTVSAQYNPKEVAFAKAVAWTPHKKAGNKTGDKDDALQLEFTSPAGRTTTVDLLFDAVEEGDSGFIMTSVSNLEQLASVQVTDPSAKDNQKRPHHCVLVWGGTPNSDSPFVQGGTKFQCVITNITVKYQVFSSDGMPLRATVTLALQEASRVAMAPAGGSS
jgi:Flp pilus assembly secretin CpaC